ncbi:Nucleoside phosphorylase [Penicillium occitanis (nom. inval.)]|nr:Nucleoside phosphorylase [Penicillium occitanis (nom. inval.)]
MNDNAWSPGDFNLHPIEDKDKDKDIETNSGAETDEAVGPVMPELKKYRECIFGDPAYEWLLRDLQKHCDLVPSSPDLSSEIRKAILQALPSQTTFTRQEPSNLYKMTYNMDWDLVSFLNEQEYSKENYQALPLVITVTGSREAAQALTCSQYLHQTWPSSAAGILGLLQTLLIPEEKNKATGDLPDGTKLAAWLYFSERLRVYRIAVEVIGSTYSVIEVGELLSWLGSALQLSPYPDQIAYCRPRVSQFQTIRRSHGKEESQYAAEGSAEIEFTIDRKGQSLGISGECWHGLFRHCVVVEGYPVSRRLEEGAIHGLEIPLGMMASLAQAKYVNNFLGVPILKGFSAMLVPTDVHDELVSWHLVYNKNGDRISYLDSGVTPAQGLMAGRLSQTRHILGWCSDAKYLAGTKDAKHKVGRSRLPKPRENGIFGQTFISSGQMITGGAPFLVGYKDTPFHVSRAGYIRKLKWIIQKSVVLWDEETKRGWLLNAARALLHLVRASIMHDSTGPLSSECLFQWDKLEEAPADTAHAPESAIKVLLNHNNRALKIYEGKNDLVKFEDRVEHFLNMLEQIFDYEVYAVGPDGDGYNSKSIPRAHFEGWDFHDLATESDPLYPRLANMAPKGKAWIDFTRSIHAINLLGSDFGEILEPLNSSCPHWASLPKNQYYLAAGIADLQMIVEYTGDLTANPIRLNENLVWHNPERIFNFCGCVDASASHTDIVQVILPATLSDSAECNSSIDLQHNGAVVFGYCRDFQWRWGDSGDPKKDDIRADDAHLSAKYDLGQEHSTTSSVGSKSDYAPLSGSDGPSVEDTIQTSVENESTKPKSLSRSYTRWNLETLQAEDYAVGIVCALPLELLAVRALFDQTHPNVQFSAADTNHYALGRWGRHRVVAACLPDGEYGTNSAADVASNLRRSFPSVKFCLMVGIGGGVPSSRNDIRLGDVVVSKPIGINPGVIQYDMGKALKNGVFEQNGVLHAPPRLIMTALSNLKSDPYLSENPLQEYVDEIGACRKEYRYPGSHRDRLFSSRYLHNSKHVTCDRCSDAHVIVRPVRSNPYPRIHYGLVASGNTVIKDAVLRDKWSAEKNVLCFEMEAAGVMNILPCLVIRGICDYSDSHKNKSFQEYAAATAASYAKLLLSYIKDTSEIDGMALRSIKDDQSFFGAFRTALTLFPMHRI